MLHKLSVCVTIASSIPLVRGYGQLFARRGLMSGSADAVWAAGGGAPPAGTSELGSGAGTALNDWPLVSALELGSLPTAAGCARDHTKLVLAEWGLLHLVDDAAMLVSELVTNALRASWKLAGHPPIALRLLADQHQL